MPRLHLAVLTPETKPTVCENGFSSYLYSFLRELDNKKNIFLQAFPSVPGCQTCMCKRGINFSI